MIEIVRLGYSRNPWRLVDRNSGSEVVAEVETFHHPDLGPMQMSVHGYQTKREATDALGRLAARLLHEREDAR